MTSNVVVNTYHIGYPDLDGCGASFLTVLVKKSHGPYKCYSGIVKLPDPTDPSYPVERNKAAQRVALRGTPESFERAVTFYPIGLDKSNYD